MSTNSFDHRQLADDDLTDGVVQNIAAQFAAGQPLEGNSPIPTIAGATGVTGAALGAGSMTFRGNITFGTTSTGPGNGTLITVTYPVALKNVPRAIFVTPNNTATANLAPFGTLGTTASFAIGSGATAATSQGATAYQVSYEVLS